MSADPTNQSPHSASLRSRNPDTSEVVMMSYAPLRCTSCGSSISPLLEYVSGSYSEHRNHVGYECDDCPATWDKRGEPTPRAIQEREPDALCVNCGGGIVHGYHHPWLHMGGWLLCPILPGEKKPSRVATPPDLCHNGHPFEPGHDADALDEPGDPRWCDVCGEARRDAITTVAGSVTSGSVDENAHSARSTS